MIGSVAAMTSKQMQGKVRFAWAHWCCCRPFRSSSTPASLHLMLLVASLLFHWRPCLPGPACAIISTATFSIQDPHLNSPRKREGGGLRLVFEMRCRNPPAGRCPILPPRRNTSTQDHQLLSQMLPGRWAPPCLPHQISCLPMK